MAGINKVILIGNLGNDPEVRSLQSGSKVVNFNIATTESWTNRQGEKVEQTEWHRIELWEGMAGIAEQYLKKGDKVYIEGKIRSEKWTDQNGQERTTVKIRGMAMELLGGISRTTGERAAANTTTSELQAAPSSLKTPPSVELATNGGDDLPF